jgi:hypothetical protein
MISGWNCIKGDHDNEESKKGKGSPAPGGAPAGEKPGLRVRRKALRKSRDSGEFRIRDMSDEEKTVKHAEKSTMQQPQEEFVQDAAVPSVSKQTSVPPPNQPEKERKSATTP